MISHLLNIVYGIVFGVANIIPGVSGGTMMVVFGVYDKVVDVLTLKLSAIKKNIRFIVFFGIGAVIGILGFSFVITWLFDNFPVATNMFFMGLIIGSIPLIYRNMTVGGRKITPKCLIAFIPALALVVGMTYINKLPQNESFTVNAVHNATDCTVTIANNGSYDIKSNWQLKVNGKVEGELTGCVVKKSSADTTVLTGTENSAIAKGESITLTLPESTDIDSIQTDSFTYTYKMNPVLFITLLLGVTVAAVAMIIPGVSGSFVMVLLGLYTTVIGAIKSLDFMILIPTAIGVFIGIVFGAKLISALMKRYSLLVYSAIMGLVIGSLYAVFPDGFGFNLETLAGVAALIVGGAIAVLVGKNTEVEQQ